MTLHAGSKITELVIPNLDANELGVDANLEMKFAPASVQLLAQAPAIAGGPATTKGPKAFTNQFKLAIDGLDCTDIERVSSVTARIRPGSAPQISTILLELNEHSGIVGPWKAWFESFVVQGNNSDAQEKNGKLEIVGSEATNFITFGLKGLGIVRMSRKLAAEGSAGSAIRHEIELYCEGMAVKTAGASTSPTDPDKTPETEDPAA